MTPEEKIHLLAPYLPTDRFRALLRGADLPTQAEGAALIVDITGFTHFTTSLVTELGARQASDELKRKLNPMFEAIAGQVFNHGGSVIRFTGDGFVAWFDDHHIDPPENFQPVAGCLRALAAGLEMQQLMRFFKSFKLKVAVGCGQVYRGAVGNPKHGLVDVLFGPAVEDMFEAVHGAVPGTVAVTMQVQSALVQLGVMLEPMTENRLIVQSVENEVAKNARTARWPLYRPQTHDLDRISSFLNFHTREQLDNGLTSFVGELRDALPMFVTLTCDESLHSEEVMVLLNTYTQAIQEEIKVTGGRLVSIELIGNRMLYFLAYGSPITYGDDAARAVSTALALRDWAGRQRGISGIQVGISRGLLYAGVVGGEVRHEYSTIGDETNLAARLAAYARPGQILVTSRVRKETSQQIIYRELAPIYVRGRDDEIQIAEPTARRSVGYRRSQMKEFVGRTREIEQIQKLLKAVGLNLPRILRVEGLAGIGKSRLVIEVERLAHERGFRVITGQCNSTDQSTPYLPWRELLASLIGLSAEHSQEENAARLAIALQESNPDWLLRLPLLAEMLALPYEETAATETLKGESRRQALFALTTDLLLFYARRKPLVLIFDDIHWIDELSATLALELARRLTIDPEAILLTLVHRPQESINPDQRWIPELIDVVSDMYIQVWIALTDLTRDEVAQLIQNHLKVGIPEALTEFVYHKAQGNPFFIREVLDTLEETGSIRLAYDTLVIERDLNESDLPRNVQDLVQSRIDRLDPAQKMMLKVAAVIGHQFQIHILQESLSAVLALNSYDEFLKKLDELEKREFVHIEEGENDLTYAFKHMIIQEVIYQNMISSQRGDLHRYVGIALEKITPDAVERLAYHFERAVDSEGDAWHYLRLAAEKTNREYANQAALTYYDRLLDLANRDVTHRLTHVTLADRFDISCERLRIMLRIGNHDRALIELGTLSHLTERSSRIDWLIVTKTFRAQYFAQMNRWREALAEALDGVSLSTAHRDDNLMWDAYLLLSEAYRHLNMRAALQSVLPQLHALVTRLQDPRKQISLMLQELDDIYAENPELARSRAQRALNQADAVDDRPLIAQCLRALADIYIRDNNQPAALSVFRRQIDILRQVGDRRGEGETLTGIGIALVDLGQFSEGNAYLLDGYKILRQLGAAGGEARSLVYLGVIAGHRRAYDEALAYINRGLATMRDLNLTEDIGSALIYRGNIYLLKNEPTLARMDFKEAQSFLEQVDRPTLVAEAEAGLAESALHMGELQNARAHIRRILPYLEDAMLQDTLQPGLMYWRAILTLDRLAQFHTADLLRGYFYRLQATITEGLPEPTWRESFIQNIWYHYALNIPIYKELA
jgi:class 3 adenylate cyclase/tetratricopeptide (TPR) repeat protein